MKNILTIFAVILFGFTASAQIKNGDKAADFNFSDIKGKAYTMESFKGKIVYIDVWATWCPPCRAEIPALKALEEALKGQKIEFVSISIDKDKAAWEKFVPANQMTGVQLYAGTAEAGRAFSSAYVIPSIPRFIIVGKDGKVINNNAPRPSDPNTVNLLKDLLK